MTEQEIAQKPVSFQEFSSRIKAKYPDYKDVDDLTLAQKMIEKYPDYKDQVQFEQPLTYMQKELRQRFPENYQDGSVVKENLTTEKDGIGTELAQQAKQGTNEIVAAAYGIPGYAYDFVGAGLRGLGLNVPEYKDSGFTKDVNVAGVDINPLSILEKAKDDLLGFAKKNAEKVRQINPDIDRGVVEPIQNGEYAKGIRNLFSSMTQSAPASAAMMLSGGLSTASQVGAGAALFGSQNLNQADQEGDYGKVSRDAVVAISSVTGALESIFETSFGSGAAGKAIAGIIKKDGEKAAVETVKKGFQDNVIKMITENPWMQPFGEAYEEMGTQLAQNAVNKYSGYKPETNLMDGVYDAGIMGFGMGSVHGGMIGAAKKAFGNNSTPEQPGSQQTSQPVQSGPVSETPQLTVDPRQATEATFRQMGEEFAHKETGNISLVNYVTPGLEKNKPMFVIQDAGDGSFLLQDEKGNRKWATKDLIAGNLIEISVDDFVSQKMSEFDQQSQLKESANQDKMIYKNRLVKRSANPDENKTGDSEFWFDDQTEQEVEIPNEVVRDWEKRRTEAKGENLNMIETTYGKTNVTGIKNEDGSFTVSDPATEEQANSLKSEVEKATGGKATVQAELILNEDATAPRQFQLSIIPVQNQPAPTERKIISQSFGNTSIDIIENEGYDEVVPTDKVPLEKALPILEKKFMDNKKYDLRVEKEQIKIPGETKWDKPTLKTVIKSIKVYPKTSENINHSEQQAKNADNLFDSLFEAENNQKINQASNKISPNRFRTIPTIDELQSKVDEIQSLAPNAAPVILVQSVDELPSAIKNHRLFSLGISGVWYNDKVYVMTDKIKSIDHLVELWIHENGIHNGLRNILPINERNLLMIQVYDSFRKIAEIKPEIKALFDWVNREYAGTTKQARGEELLANLSERIVSKEDLRPELKSIWNETVKYLRALLSKLYNFNGSLLSEGQLIEIIRVSVQSNFQENEHVSSIKRGSRNLLKGEQRNLDGSEGDIGGQYEDQSNGWSETDIRSGRILDGIGIGSTNEGDSRLINAEAIRELDSSGSGIHFKKDQVPLSSLLETASERVKQRRMPEKVRNKTDRFVSRFINGNTAIKILLEKFDLKVPDYANIYLAVNQKSSRQMGQKNSFEKKLFNPMLRSVEKIMEVLEKNGLKREEAYKKVTEYMIARHAIERNGWFRSLGKKGNNFSGMTDEQATAIYEKFENEISKELIDELWINTRSCTERIAKYWTEYGKYSEDSLNAMMDRNWKYYVPLRGFEPIAEEIQLDYERSEKRSEFAGDEKTEGRESMADDPIAYIYQMGTSAIMWGERNYAKRSAYNLIKLNSNRKDLFQMSQMNYMTDNLGMVTEVVNEPFGTYIDQKGNEKPDHKVFLMNTDNEGNTKKTELGFKSILEKSGYKFSSSRLANPLSEKPAYLRKQHEVEVYVDGSKFKMVFKDPAISNAINGDNYSQAINFKYLPIASITRFMSRGVTSWRPSFITSNTYRDFKTGAKTMFIQRGFKDSLKFQAKYTTAARFLASNMLNDVWRNSSKTGDYLLDIVGLEPKTEEEKQWKKWYDEYNLNGGPTGHAHLMPLDEVKLKVDRFIKHIKRSRTDKLASLANPMNALKLMEGLAGYGESIARFTAYVMARERGESIIKSINEAKEITTNFDTKGEYAASIGSFIMFFNASVQGAAKQYDLAKNHTFRYFVINAVSLVIQGLLSRYLWDLFNGDDDDKDYAEISKYTIYNNTVIGWKDNYVSIPLAQGYRVWNALGVAMYEHHMGRLSTEQMAFDMAEVFSQALSPVEISGIFDKDNKLSAPKTAGILFSAIKPLMDVSINENYQKKAIYREPFLKSQQGKYADSQMYFNNTNAMIVSFTRWLYKQGGGDPEIGTKTIKGKRILEAYDWNPAKIEHILKSYTGGPGQTVLDAANYLILKAVDDVDKRIKDSEHKIEGFDPTSIPILQTYYHKKYTGLMYNEYRDLANQAEVLKFEEERRKLTKNEDNEPELSEDQLDFIDEYELTNDYIRELLDDKKELTNEDEIKAIDLEILGLRRGFVSKFKYFEKN